MNIYNIKNMTKGWFVGDFEPSIFRTKQCEVGVKNYKKGDFEEKHYHKLATEITLIQSGRAVMCNRELGPGDVIQLEPNTATSFLALEDTTTVVVKIPSVAGDKYFGDPT